MLTRIAHQRESEVSLGWLILLVCLLGACGKDDSSPSGLNRGVAYMGWGFTEVFLPAEATQFQFRGSFDEKPDFLVITADTLVWLGNEILDKRGQFAISIPLKANTQDQPLRIDTLVVKSVRDNGRMTLDTVVAYRSKPQVRPLYGPRLPVVDADGAYLLEFRIAHPADLAIDSFWLDGIQDSTRCHLDSARSLFACALRLTALRDTLTLRVQDEAYASAATSVEVFRTETPAQLLTNLDSQLHIPYRNRIFSFTGKLLTDSVSAGLKLTAGKYSWDLDSLESPEGLLTVQVPLPRLRKAHPLRQTDTLVFYLRDSRGSRLDSLTRIVHRSRPDFQLRFPGDAFQGGTLVLRYPDTLARVSVSFADSQPIPISALWINGRKTAKKDIGSAFSDSIPLHRSETHLTVRVSDVLGSVTEKVIPFKILGRPYTADVGTARLDSARTNAVDSTRSETEIGAKASTPS